MYGDINFIHYFCSWNDSSIKDDYILKTISFISTHFISTDFLMRAKKVFLFLLAILIADISALSKNRIIKDPEVEYTPPGSVLTKLSLTRMPQYYVANSTTDLTGG